MINNNVQVDKHIDVLDGVRAVAMIFVVWYHFWQQTWLTPYVNLPAGVTDITRYIGITNINLEGFVRYGFVFVDMLILLSAFCNFYPYARAILLGEPWPDTVTFYKKRAARILPSYYLALLVMLIVKLVEGTAFTGAVCKDLLAHIFCIAPLFPETYISPYFNGVLWTVQIEILYYIVMPLLAKAFRKWPVVTSAGLWGIGIISANYIVCNHADSIRYYGNQVLTFAGCYANGMLLAMLYITIKKKNLENTYTRLVATIAAFCCILHLSGMMKELGSSELQIVQLQQRLELSLVFSVFLLALPFACKAVKQLFSNKVVTFLAVISYNLYIWHQYIAVKLKEYRIPYWEGDIPPNQTGDKVWMWQYQILIVAVSLIVAVLLTYFFERPVARRILKWHFPILRKPNKTKQ